MLFAFIFGELHVVSKSGGASVPLVVLLNVVEFWTSLTILWKTGFVAAGIEHGT